MKQKKEIYTTSTIFFNRWSVYSCI